MISRSGVWRLALAAVLLALVPLWASAKWRHYQWEKSFESEWQARLDYCVSLDSKRLDEFCRENVIDWMAREKGTHPPPTLWNLFSSSTTNPVSRAAAAVKPRELSPVRSIEEDESEREEVELLLQHSTSGNASGWKVRNANGEVRAITDARSDAGTYYVLRFVCNAAAGTRTVTLVVGRDGKDLSFDWNRGTSSARIDDRVFEHALAPAVHQRRQTC